MGGSLRFLFEVFDLAFDDNFMSPKATDIKAYGRKSEANGTIGSRGENIRR
jgi:hypothetical protein